VAIQSQAITKIFRVNGQPVRALDEVCLEVMEGEFLMIVGPSGAGKSTLLNMIAGLDCATQGSIEVLGMNPAKSSPDKIYSWRSRNIGFIPQNRHLIEKMSVFENVELSLLSSKISREERRDRVLHALSILGIKGCAALFPRELSRSEQLRVAATRAIIADPSLILADQICNTDAETMSVVLDLLKQMNQRCGKTIVLFTLDIQRSGCAHTTRHLNSGRLLPAPRWD
jgi:putative ABC transport system ATP-binding protein